ncbi:MAG: ATP-binding protein [Nannocystis sp.]|nr:ATP-binding protein [Nannocystis sp.]
MLIIDEILIALGWPKETFHPETRTSDGTYMDYRITLDGDPRFIVEAKRIGNTFAPSAKKLRKTEYRLSFLRQSFGAPFTEVLRQAEDYCRNAAIPFAVLTNGAEWVVAQVLPPPGVTEERLQCYYIGNLLDESPNIDLMWELLSSNGVSELQLEEAFSRLNLLEADYCAEPRALIGELRWETPADHPDLSEFYHCFFDEITDPGRRNMLEHCYVTSAKLDQYHGELKRTLIDTSPSFVDDAEELSPGDTRKVLPDTSGDQKGRVVLVVGSVGAGKSTFVTRTLIENRDVQGLVFVTLDLINEAVLHADSPPGRLWTRLKETWIERYPDALDHKKLRQAFHAEIEQLRRGPSADIYAKHPDRFDEAKATKLEALVADPEKCLQRMWRLSASSAQARVVVFLDNVDRASEAFQHRMYAFAHAVAAETGATVIVTMRESTYYRAKESGFLDVRTSDKVFHLQAPNVVQLISKRVSYVEEHMDQDHRATAWRREKDWGPFQATSRRYASALKVTFLQDNDGHRLLSVLAALAWHNIRAFLATLRRIHMLLAVINSTRWTENQVLSALLAADTSGSLRAIPATLYRPPSKLHSCFLLKLRLLLLLKVGVRRLEQQHGVGYPRIIEFGRVYGYRRKWAEAGLEELVRERLVECLQIPAEIEHTSTYQLSTEHVFRPSPLGILVVERLMYQPIYLATSAWEIPYHTKDDFDKFKIAAKDALSSDDLVECALDADKADLLGISEVPGVVVRVLAAAREKEILLTRDLTGRAEVSSVEEKLREALDKLGATKQGEPVSRVGPRESNSKQPSQTTLPLDSHPSPTKAELTKIPIPPNVNAVKISSSTSAPAVFWALTFAHVNSLGPQSGAEVTKIINTYLRDDYQQLEHTNISRLLRSPSFLKHKWLRRTGMERRWRFALAPGWREQWVTTFSTEAPV